MLPPAPVLLSTITGCFHSLDSLSATMRHSVSFEPPAGNGTMMRTDFCGQVWAAAGDTASSSAARTARKRIFIPIC
ncbi:MAG TPA: hypothetical protein VLA02_16025 [Reyranella sp.]|nr:hypothetical protein [Reyranella sp.]